MTNATDALRALIADIDAEAQAELGHDSGMAYRLERFADRLREAIGTPAGSASGEDGMCYCQEGVTCPACEIDDGGPYNGIDWQATCETLQAEVARLTDGLNTAVSALRIANHRSETLEAALAEARRDDWTAIASRVAEDILRGPLEHVPANEGGSGVTHAQHLAWMCMKLAAKDVGSATKCCRWLGYVQGAMVEGGWSTLDEEKERNKRFAALHQRKENGHAG